MSVPTKTYCVTDPETTLWCYVQAETASKARYKARLADDSDSMNEDWDWPKGYSAKRVPELDGDLLTMSNLVRLGMAIDECRCGREARNGEVFLDEDDGEGLDDPAPVFIAPGGQWWCTERCWKAHGSPTEPERPNPNPHGICLYADY